MREIVPWLLWEARQARKQGLAAMERRQRARLAKAVVFARANSPYYRELYQDLPGRVDDPTLLPTKARRSRCHTSTTGSPTPR